MDNTGRINHSFTKEVDDSKTKKPPKGGLFVSRKLAFVSSILCVLCCRAIIACLAWSVGRGCLAGLLSTIRSFWILLLELFNTFGNLAVAIQVFPEGQLVTVYKHTVGW